MNSWLDSWTTVRRAKSYRAAKRFATRRGHSADILSTVFVLSKTERKARDATECAARTPITVPIAYDDPKAQAAFEAVYRTRLHLLRGANGQSPK